MARGLGYAFSMKHIGEIKTFEDQAFLAQVSRLSGVLLAAGLACCAVAFLLLPAVQGRALPVEGAVVTPGWWFSLAGLAVASLAWHELVHAALFRLFAPAGAHVTFGFSRENWMLYACAEGVVYTRRQYLAVALAPAAAVTALLAAAGAVLGWPLWAAVLAVVHLAGCAGDILYAQRIAADKRVTHCMDTAQGVALLSDEGGAS